MAIVHGHSPWVDLLTDLKSMADRQEWKGQRSKKKRVRKPKNSFTRTVKSIFRIFP